MEEGRLERSRFERRDHDTKMPGNGKTSNEEENMRISSKRSTKAEDGGENLLKENMRLASKQRATMERRCPARVSVRRRPEAAVMSRGGRSGPPETVAGDVTVDDGVVLRVKDLGNGG
ncbi:hypothetical protein Nepgr_027627 [Nepenthes gracilis]|uniref:Uncharacterized protein n=1 Tax=Nepenthes gracilis TaxID=150966 RepID=A0AAD3Y3A7_NEPGR|nr:hypothetical protein Nepgr_027627 [Nepenthes gracilis]